MVKEGCIKSVVLVPNCFWAAELSNIIPLVASSCVTCLGPRFLDTDLHRLVDGAALAYENQHTVTSLCAGLLNFGCVC